MNTRRVILPGLLFAFAALTRSVVVGQTFPTTGPSQKVINLVCIGDSITAAGSIPDRDKNGPAAILARELAHHLPAGTTVCLSNVGMSGTTTEDWIPPRGLVVRLAETQARKLADAHPDGQLIFSIMLGTNDSANRGPHGSPIAAEHYQQNLKLIADRLIAGHPDCLIFIHHPIFYTKNTHNSSDYEGDSAYERLRSYFPVIAALIAGDEQSTPRHLYPGDIDAYDHFAQSWQTELTPEQGQHGTFYLHPNLKGAEALGKYWAAAILKQIE